MNELYHHGILGQKWGIRRYQNPDGTLTDAGKKRLNKDVERLKSIDYSKDPQSFNKVVNKMPSARQFTKEHKSLAKQIKKDRSDVESNTSYANSVYNAYFQAYLGKGKEYADKCWGKSMAYVNGELRNETTNKANRLRGNEIKYEEEAKNS